LVGWSSEGGAREARRCGHYGGVELVTAYVVLKSILVCLWDDEEAFNPFNMDLI